MDDTQPAPAGGGVHGIQADIRGMGSVAEQCVGYKAVSQSVYCILKRGIQLVQLEQYVGLEPVVPEYRAGPLIHVIFAFQKDKGVRQDGAGQRIGETVPLLPGIRQLLRSNPVGGQVFVYGVCGRDGQQDVLLKQVVVGEGGRLGAGAVDDKIQLSGEEHLVQ